MRNIKLSPYVYPWKEGLKAIRSLENDNVPFKFRIARRDRFSDEISDRAWMCKGTGTGTCMADIKTDPVTRFMLNDAVGYFYIRFTEINGVQAK